MDVQRVLLIEDNPGDVRLILEALAEVSDALFDLEYADRLSVGLVRLPHGKIDLILLDLGLPDSQGLDTFTQAHAHARDVPIVILTSLDDVALAVKAVQAGAQDYLVKGLVDSNLVVRAMLYSTSSRPTSITLPRI